MASKKKLKETVVDLEIKLSTLEWKLGRLSHDLEGIGRKANGFHIMDLNNTQEPVKQQKDLSEVKDFLYGLWSSIGTTREAIIPVVINTSLIACRYMKVYSMSASKLHDMLDSLTEEDIDRIEQDLTEINNK